MGDSQIGLLGDGNPRQLKRAKTSGRDLDDFVAPIVMTHNPGFQPKQFHQLANVRTISRSHYQRETSLLELLDDGNEEWDVGRIIQVDPNLRICISLHSLLFAFLMIGSAV